MIKNDEILSLIKNYNKLFFNKKYEKMIDLFYYEDIILYKKTIQEFAKKMDFFGESEILLKKINLKNLDELNSLDEKKLFINIFTSIQKKTSAKELERILNSIRIIKIESIEYLITIIYEIELKIYNEFLTIENKLDLIKLNNEYKILFKPIDLTKFQNQIDSYFINKSRDKTHLLTKNTELHLFKIYGFKNEDGEVIIEPRFKDALPFGENKIAPVKIMNKWGFINFKGELISKPQYDDVTTFNEGIAGVKIGEKWSFVDSNCILISDFIFDDIQAFSENLCAVKIEKKWGFIDNHGKLIIEPKFKKVESFFYGTTEVTYKNSEGKIAKYTIDKNENIID